MRLGELLVESKKVSRHGVAEALEAQVVHGGRLGTNLLELGLVTEKDVADALGQLHHLPSASGALVPDPRALSLVEPRFADDNDLVPMRLDANRLSVAILDPKRVQALDTLAFRTGKRVIAVVVPEVRVIYLLRKHYRALRTLRAVDLEGHMLTPERAGASPAVAAKGPDLMSEADFQRIYAHATEPEHAPSATAPLPALLVAEPAVQAGAGRDVPEVAPPSAEPAEVRVELPSTPMTFAEAQGALSQSSNREIVANAVLRFAVSKFRRAVLLSVHRSGTTGWCGLGDGITLEGVQRIAISAASANTFKLVRDTSSHFIGPLRQDAATELFFKLLGKGPPKTAVMMPLLARGKIVHILYVDSGPGKLTPPDVGELLILSQGVARSYETMIAQRRLEGMR